MLLETTSTNNYKNTSTLSEELSTVAVSTPMQRVFIPPTGSPFQKTQTSRTRSSQAERARYFEILTSEARVRGTGQALCAKHRSRERGRTNQTRNARQLCRSCQRMHAAPQEHVAPKHKSGPIIHPNLASPPWPDKFSIHFQYAHWVSASTFIFTLPVPRAVVMSYFSETCKTKKSGYSWPTFSGANFWNSPTTQAATSRRQPCTRRGHCCMRQQSPVAGRRRRVGHYAVTDF